MYLSYEDYQIMGGSLDETTFSDYAFEAESIINWYTFNRLTKETEFSDNVKRLMFRLIKLAQLSAEAMSIGIPTQGGGTSGGYVGSIANQNNDGFSTSYNVVSAQSAIDMSSVKSPKVRDLVTSYLQFETNSLGQRVLYRGLYPNE